MSIGPAPGSVGREAYCELAKTHNACPSGQTNRLASRESKDGNWEFYTDASWDLSDHVPNDCLRPSNWFPDGECDLITAVMPDFSGLLWWATRGGRVGTINQETGEITAIQLNGEEIQNGFSVAEDGVYIVSDHAMYGFSADENGEPVQRWREPSWALSPPVTTGQ